MSSSHAVKVSIGLPVYNGGRFVAHAIESILAQTFADFELVITDNDSTDDTGEICRSYAARDNRVRYHRLARNIGAILNFERVYMLCGAGEYFKWAAHDDALEPEFLAACVEALDANRDAVLAYTKARVIDSQGRPLREYTVKLATDSPRAAVRFGAVACSHHKHTSNLEIFGLMRRSAVERIPQQGSYAGSDRVFIARLAMCGRLIEVPRVLFLWRDHPSQSIKTLPDHLRKKRSLLSRLIGSGQLPPAEWFDPKYKGKITFPEWRLAREYLASIGYGDVSTSERILAAMYVLKRQLVHKNWARMGRDFLMAGDQMAAQMVEKMRDPFARHDDGEMDLPRASDAPTTVTTLASTHAN
jgi:glycosyltransferase involved in cell wall biosynthesis